MGDIKAIYEIVANVANDAVKLRELLADERGIRLDWQDCLAAGCLVVDSRDQATRIFVESGRSLTQLHWLLATRFIEYCFPARQEELNHVAHQCFCNNGGEPPTN